MIQLQTRNEQPLFVLQAYAPDSSYNDIEKNEFYDNLQQEINTLPRRCNLIILGDFNGKVGKYGCTRWPNVVGRFSTSVMNDGGERLLQFCTINNLSVMNTMHKHKDKRLNTWTSPDGRHRLTLLLFPTAKEAW